MHAKRGVYRRDGDDDIAIFPAPFADEAQRAIRAGRLRLDEDAVGRPPQIEERAGGCGPRGAWDLAGGLGGDAGHNWRQSGSDRALPEELAARCHLREV